MTTEAKRNEMRRPEPLRSSISPTDVKLIFTQKEVVGNYLFRLDRIRRHLMVSHAFDPLRLIFMAELDKIRSVSLKRIYRDIRSGQIGSARLDEFLDSVHFRFEFHDGRKPVHLPLFEKRRDTAGLLSLLDERARSWYGLLSRLLQNQTKRLPEPIPIKYQ